MTTTTTPRYGVFTADTKFDSVAIDIRREETIDPDRIQTWLGDVQRGTLFQVRSTDPPNPLFPLLDGPVKRGEARLRWITPIGTYWDEDLPFYLKEYVHVRNPFLRTSPTFGMTQVQKRRKRVTDWARANTTNEILAKVMVESVASPTADALTGKKRFTGQIWWQFVLMNLAAAQHDPWLEDLNVWPALERNIQIDAHAFVATAAIGEWNTPAGYMESFSRVYQAGGALSVAPVHIRLVPPLGPVQPILHAGAPAARNIVYGGGN